MNDYNVNNKKVRYKKKLNVKKMLMLLFILILLSILTFFATLIFTNPKYEGEKIIEIPEGAGTKRIASILKDNEVINSKLMFEIYTKVLDYDGKYRYGEFTFNDDMKIAEIMEELATGGKVANTVSVTIPEGYTIKQIGEKLEEIGLFKKEEFYEVAKNTKFNFKFLDSSKDGDYYLEGYLFPNTYEFYDTATPTDVIKTMLEGFNDNFSDEDLKKAEKLGYSYNDVITVASIIEREVKEPSERAMVAGVIYNRLKEGQKLEMCSTIQYILGKPHAKLYENDLKINSPYNTYMYEGLPIGPISNPGKASINAALNPVEHNYFYFVLMDEVTGKHYFSSTYSEHVNAKNKYIK